jgi:hypothetical protein
MPIVLGTRLARTIFFKKDREQDKNAADNSYVAE